MGFADGLLVGALAAEESSGSGFAVALLIVLWIIWLCGVFGPKTDEDDVPEGWKSFLVVSFCVLSLMSFGLYKVDSSHKTKTVAVSEQVLEKPKLVVDYIGADGFRHEVHEGDIHTFKFDVALVHGGYVGTGPATEEIKFTDSYTYPGKHFGPGWNGLPRNSGPTTYQVKFRSVFGSQYVCYVWTRYVVDTTFVDELDESGKLVKRGVYLAHMQWQDKKTLSVKLVQSSPEELRQMDEAVKRGLTF